MCNMYCYSDFDQKVELVFLVNTEKNGRTLVSASLLAVCSIRCRIGSPVLLYDFYSEKTKHIFSLNLAQNISLPPAAVIYIRSIHLIQHKDVIFCKMSHLNNFPLLNSAGKQGVERRIKSHCIGKIINDNKPS
ncbi:hypothetical protein GOODEAATRI_001483 [Goodea atripinnis]|uniref:Uncharacterized protein n=1 Tax=Goodea atripinnis TaxID=208336 RepID=A0ABV0N710_9TELE